MSSNDYGNLGNEMKTMKDARKNLAAQTKAQGRKRKAEAQQMLAPVKGKLKAQGRQMTSDADKMMAGIRKDVADLQADTQQTLAPVKGELKAQGRQIARNAEKMMAGIRKDVDTLKAEAGRIVADAAAMMNRLAEASRERAAAWRDVLQTICSGQGAPTRAFAATAVMERPARTRAGTRKKAPAKKR